MQKSPVWNALAALAALTMSCATSVDEPADETTESCDPPSKECGERCVDPQTDPANCGDCGVACASGKCTAGVCDSACAMPLSECNGTCVDLQNDSANCGVCGVSCQAPLVCGSGMCGAACPTGQKNCNAMCIEVQTDPKNCGDCGNECSTEASCTSGVCQDVCSPGQSYCSGVCADLQTDEAHCGSCIETCQFDETCEAGTCTAICTPPEEYCSGVCVDKKADEANCGSCGVVCTTGQLCTNGLCQCQGGVCGSCGVTDLGSVSPQSVMGSTFGGTDALSGDCTFGGSPEAVYSFTASVDGNYKFDTTGSSYDAAVYLLNTACMEFKCSADFDAKVSTNLTANETVYVVVDGDFGSAGNYVLSISNGPVVPCPNAVLGSTVPATVTGDTSLLADNLLGTCGSSSSPENTYSFTAPMAGVYSFDTFGSSFDTVLYVLDGTCNGIELACSDDAGGGVAQSQVGVDLAAGQTVVVVVDGYDSLELGAYSLNVTQIACPQNDLGSVTPQTVTGDTTGQPSVGAGSCGGNGPDVTYSFTAPTTATYTFDTIGSPLDTVLYVRDGTCGGVELACDDDGSVPNSIVTVPLTAGQTVVVVVDSYSSPDAFTLHIQ